ncbi:MAG: DUF389 domain-containing protein [Chloroflexi bacterium]|nr:DUF389 domain-containing protein [Chloroflexota bacterium]
MNSQAVLLLGVLVAPLMTPWVGFLLAILTGSIRFLFETVMALFISVVLVFLGGLITGFAANILPEMARDNVYIHSRIWLPALLVLAVGAITLVASFARSEEKPFLPSVVVAYLFFLPINAVGFGISAGLQDVWLQGLLVFAAHFALATVLGLATFFLLRLKPSFGGVVFSGITFVLFGGLLIVLMGSGSPSVAATPRPADSPDTACRASFFDVGVARPHPNLDRHSESATHQHNRPPHCNSDGWHAKPHPVDARCHPAAHRHAHGHAHHPADSHVRQDSRQRRRRREPARRPRRNLHHDPAQRHDRGDLFRVRRRERRNVGQGLCHNQRTADRRLAVGIGDRLRHARAKLRSHSHSHSHPHPIKSPVCDLESGNKFPAPNFVP